VRPRAAEPLEAFARRTLVERKRSLMRRRETAESDERELLAEREPGWQDQAAHQSAAAELEGLADNERAQLALVVAALERLDDGSWGRCARCGQPIREARLRAVPEAARCAKCTNHG
jgi:RNA polymerase-binding transcription factor DksA